MMPSIMFPFCSIESSAFLLGLCSCSMNVLLSVAPVRGVFLWGGLTPVSLGLFCGSFHLLPDRTGSVGIVGRRPQLIVRRLPLRQWPRVGQMPPRQKRPIFNWDALIVVDDLIRGVAGRLGECPNIHGALGRIILVKAGSLGLLDTNIVKALVLLYPRRKILFQSSAVAAVMPPFILPLAVLVIIASLCDIGRGRCGVMPQRKAPAVFQHDGLNDLIALIFVHIPSSP